MNQNTLSAAPRSTSPRFASTREERARLATARSRSKPSARRSAAEGGLDFRRFALLGAASFSFWSLIARDPEVGGWAAYALAIALSVAVFGLMLRQRAVIGLTLLSYLAAVQPPLRLYAPALPYLALNYLLIGCALLLLVQGKRPLQIVLPILFYGFYTVLEVAGMLGATSSVYGRAVFVPSLTILIYLALAFKFRFSRQDILGIFLGYIAGTLGIVAIILTRFQSAALIEWGTESSASASGGMGGNQITFLLAVGAFMCFLCADEIKGARKIVFWGLAGALAYFMILTFSRGGLYMLVAVTVLYYLVLKRPSAKTLGALALFGLIGLGVYSATMQTTGGQLMNRYSETTLTNRDRIAAGGWQIFLDNSLFGVGTGNFYSKIEGVNGLGTVGAHNELIRAAAEHGIFGLASWVLFAVTGLAYAASGPGSQDRDKRALRITFFIFVMLSMAYNGLKLLVQPFLVLIALGAFTAEYDALRAARRAQRHRNEQLKMGRVRHHRASRRRARAAQDTGDANGDANANGTAATGAFSSAASPS